MAGRDIIVVGASAGGVEALQDVLRGVPAEFPGSIFVVLHLLSDLVSHLPQILKRAAKIQVCEAVDGAKIEGGRVYVAAPDQHLLVWNGSIRLSHGPRENRARPAVDPLFRSAARWYGPRVVGVILTGSMDDGRAGALAVERAGGMVLAQDPEEALFSSMPLSAIEEVKAAEVLPLLAIGRRLDELARAAAPEDQERSTLTETTAEEEAKGMGGDMVVGPVRNLPGRPSKLACPECGGLMREIHGRGTGKQEYVRYRCRIGHAFSPETLLEAQARGIEEALASALLALEENAILAEGVAGRARESGHLLSAERFERMAGEVRERAKRVRKLLRHGVEASWGESREEVGSGGVRGGEP